MPTARQLNVRHGLRVGTKSVVDSTGILTDVGDLSTLITTNKTSIINALNEVEGSFNNITTAQVAENPAYLYYTNARARGAVSVTDSGGDGSLSYDSVSGVFTYTGPSANEVRAHFTGGTGVSITNGIVAIGQPVGTTNNVSFANVTLSGVLYGPSQFVIDPAVQGDATGEVIILGNLKVEGTTTTINSTTVEIEDKTILLAKSATNATDANGSGLEVAGAGANLLYAFTTDSWNPNKSLKGVDGDASSPTYSFATDPGLGLYRSADNQVSLATNGSERLRISDTTATLVGSVDLVLNRGTYGGTITTGSLTANRTYTLPNVSGTLATTADLSQFAPTTSAQLAGIITDETGTGSLVFATSPTLTTPVLGVASATSINKVSITAPATGSTLTIADGKTLTVNNTLTFTGTDTSSVAFGTGGTVAYTSNKLSVFAATTSAELAGVMSDETGSGGLVFATSPTLSGTPLSTTAAVDTNTTQIATTAFVVGQASATNPLGLGTVAIGTSLRYARQDHVHPTTGLGLTSGTLAQFAATTSSQLAGVISDETGTGALVFATSPTLTTPVLGAATGTSLALTGGSLTTRPAATQDAVIVSGRAGGTGSFAVTLTPTTLTASRTLTAPDTSGTIVTTGDTGTVTSAMIVNGTIVDADISATAEIEVSKLADGSARQLLQTDAAGTGVEWTSDIDVPGTLDVTGAAVFDGRVSVNGVDITESARDVEESRLIRLNATISVGVAGTVPFGVGPIIPPGMSLVGVGPDSYNVIDIYSGSVC